MIFVKRTNPDNLDFQELVRALDLDLDGYYKEETSFYGKLNNTEKIKHAVVAYDENENLVGCGSIKAFSNHEVEIKRMFVPLNFRGKGIALSILSALEDWGKELDFENCILETLKEKPYAIRFYEKNNYRIIPNFGDYVKANNSICFSKKLK